MIMQQRAGVASSSYRFFFSLTLLCLMIINTLFYESTQLIFPHDVDGFQRRGSIQTASFNAYVHVNGKESFFAASQSNQHKPKEERSVGSVVMISYVFGEEAANKTYLRLFAESALHSGIDVVIVGHPIPSYASLFANTNVRFFSIEWSAFVDRVRDKILEGKEPSKLRNLKSFYKVIDFKPLTASLFPEIVEGYDWWGHLDNDMVLGDVRRFIHRRKLAKYDIIAAFPHEYTSGPFMLYRNIPIVNNLFRLSALSLDEIFDSRDAAVFDEWGGGTDRGRGRRYNATMAGIVDLHHERLGLRWFGGIASVWDGFCTGRLGGEPCRYCEVSQSGKKRKMYEVDANQRLREVAFCHFENSKKAIESSLKDLATNRHDSLLSLDNYLVTFQSGIQF